MILITPNILKGKYKYKMYKIKRTAVKSSKYKPNLDVIYDTVCRLSKYDITKKLKTRERTYTRYVFYHIAFKYGYKKEEIAEKVNKHRTTVHHGLKEYEYLKDAKYFKYWIELEKEVLNEIR